MENKEVVKVYKEYPQLENYNIADLAIEEMKEEFLPLRVTGIEDKKGYEAVKAALKVVRSKKIEVEKVRKDLKADSLKYGRVVDSEAKRIVALLEPIESHLNSEKVQVDMALEDIRLEKERKEKEILEGKMKKLVEAGMVYSIGGSLVYNDIIKTEQELSEMSDDDFESLHKEVFCHYKKDQEEKLAEEKRQEEEKEKNRLEAEKLEKQRKEQEEKQRKIDEAERKIKEEKEKIKREKEMAEYKKKADEEAKIRAEEAAKKKADEIVRLQKEKEEKEKREAEEAKAEEERLKELAPDKTKINEYMNSLLSVDRPTLKSKAMVKLMSEISHKLRLICDYVKENIDKK